MRFLFYVKIQNMESLAKKEIAGVAAIKEFINEWGTVGELYEIAAKAEAELMDIIKTHDDACVDKLVSVGNLHVMMLDLLKSFEK
jgi:hypothetical protein